MEHFAQFLLFSRKSTCEGYNFGETRLGTGTGKYTKRCRTSREIFGHLRICSGRLQKSWYDALVPSLIKNFLRPNNIFSREKTGDELAKVILVNQTGTWMVQVREEWDGSGNTHFKNLGYNFCEMQRRWHDSFSICLLVYTKTAQCIRSSDCFCSLYYDLKATVLADYQKFHIISYCQMPLNVQINWIQRFYRTKEEQVFWGRSTRLQGWKNYWYPISLGLWPKNRPRNEEVLLKHLRKLNINCFPLRLRAHATLLRKQILFPCNKF